ncbi:SDR family NAD(P)-dependent oxidoreductase [Alkalihalobacillus deserti]|uniref:SDR family NAD(P)-dependent oxidoreductase n=1 Tax=Alkalihalobacillus deserti TaxID=2879466 RepID=UPI001D151217|nr:glucose 1-dehydrogenase [Alkalihalobacillus deserti]
MEGKVCLITGGGTGIGRAIALRLAKAGLNVIINYSRSEQEALETKSECEQLGVKAMVYKADVSNDQEVRKMMNDTINSFGRLDILVNNAGVTNIVPLEDLEGLKEEYWDRAMAINVKGVFFCSRAASEQLKVNNGCILNTASVAGMTGQGSSIAYAASKAAVISLTKSLARALAPEVRVNSLSPGMVLTRWTEGKDEPIKRFAENAPLGRAATPEDVAEVAYSFIANASFVTGQNIAIDGGMLM